MIVILATFSGIALAILFGIMIANIILMCENKRARKKIQKKLLEESAECEQNSYEDKLEKLGEEKQTEKQIIKKLLPFIIIDGIILAAVMLTLVEVEDKYKKTTRQLVEERKIDKVGELMEYTADEGNVKMYLGASNDHKMKLQKYEITSDLAINKTLNKFLFFNAFHSSKVEYELLIPQK